MELAASCLNSNPERRPPASQVAETLTQLAAFKDPALDSSRKDLHLSDTTTTTTIVPTKISIHSGLIPSAETIVHGNSFSEAGTPSVSTPKTMLDLEIRQALERLDYDSTRSSFVSGISHL